MPLFANLRESFWSYVSPRKTQERRDKPFKVPPVPLKIKPTLSNKSEHKRDIRLSMSPVSRVNSWHVRSPASSVAGERSLLTPVSMRREEESEVAIEDLEGDTLIEDDGYDANNETVVVDEEHYEPQAYDPEEERMKRLEQADEMRELGWTEDEITLFQKLGMRGYEPLMPISWTMDFKTIPTALFTKDDDVAFIKAAHGTDFRGKCCAFFHLLFGGQR